MPDINMSIISQKADDEQPFPEVRKAAKKGGKVGVFAFAGLGLFIVGAVVGCSLLIWKFGETRHPNPQLQPEKASFAHGVDLHSNGVHQLKIEKVPAAAAAYDFNDIFDPALVPKGFPHQWMDNRLFFRNAQGDIMQSTAGGRLTLIMNHTYFDRLNTSTWYISPNREYVLLPYEIQQVWRHSWTAKYKIYIIGQIPPDITDRLLDFPSDPILQNQRLQYCRWAANDDALVFVVGNDIFFQSSPLSGTSRATTTGQTDVIFNGIPDWLYEEDVLSSSVAHYWSPRQSPPRIVFAEFNDTYVPWQKWPTFGDEDDLYGTTTQIKYPKAGDIQPDGTVGNTTSMRLLVKDLDKPEDPPRQVPPPPELSNEDHYYTSVSWRDWDDFLVTWTNRIQNRAVVMLCDSDNLNCQKNLDITVSGGWHDAPWPKPWWITGGDYVTVLSKDEGASGTWPHVALVTASKTEEGVITWLTSGQQEVIQIVGLDNRADVVYYISTNGDPKQRHLFRVGLPSAPPERRDPVCLSCSLAPDCQYVSSSFSRNGRFQVMSCLGPGTPKVYFRNEAAERNATLEDNAAWEQAIASKQLPSRQFMTVAIGDGYQGEAEVFIPPGIATDGSEERPLLVFTYGGPGAQRVNYRHPLYSSNVRFNMYLASTLKWVIASVDGRGSMGKGDRFKYRMYRGMGTVEVEDQITGGTFFKGLPYVDANKAAIWGWSYGGHTTGHVLGSTSTVFTCGVAIAPVTSQLYYDTALTERIMSLATVADNQAGYNATVIMKKVQNFRGKKFFMAHGTADDNVHFHNAAQLIKALTEAEIQFDTMMYVDKNHNIAGTNTRPHLYTAMTTFLQEECFQP